MAEAIENINPNVYKKCEDRKVSVSDCDDTVDDPFDAREVFGEFLSVCFDFEWTHFRFIVKTCNQLYRF